MYLVKINTCHSIYLNFKISVISHERWSWLIIDHFEFESKAALSVVVHSVLRVPVCWELPALLCCHINIPH